MRIQDTNRILNESKILRSQQHEEEVPPSRFGSMMAKIRGHVPAVVGGLAALVAAGAGGALLIDQQRRSRTRRWW